MTDQHDSKTMQLPLENTATYETLDVPEDVCPTLVEILSRPRAYNTSEETTFMMWLTEELKNAGYKPTVRSMNCLSVEVPRENGNRATTLFTSHTDTVDRPTANPLKDRKALAYDDTFGHVFLDTKNVVGTCLGADDGAGVWLMLEMIKAKVPGGYLFCRGEERGGVGSGAMANSAVDKAWLKTFEVAVALDRPRTNEVITHQRGGTRCASDKFGDALAAALNKQNPHFKYAKSSAGVYTDTYEFRGLIAECVNIGVGYSNQHGVTETLDYAHLVALRDAMIALKWDALPVDRDPTIADTSWQWGRQRNWKHDVWSSDGDSFLGGVYTPPKSKKKNTEKNVVSIKEPELLIEEDVIATGGLTDWAVICETDPELAAEQIINMAAEIASLRAQVTLYKKAIRSH